MKKKSKPHPSHNVPRAGTLHEISYCKDCGMAFDNSDPCRRLQLVEKAS